MDFWPPFPIALSVLYYRKSDKDLDNILATLNHHDHRVCHIEINTTSSSLWEKALSLMQKPFPMLTDLDLRYRTDKMPVPSVVPDLFLGGSATRLRNLKLSRIPFPGLPKLLLSANHLIHLDLIDVRGITPEAMVACLSTLTRLESLTLSIESPLPRPEWERRRTSHALLRSPSYFRFRGAGEYLEDMMADSIDAPLLDELIICFFNQSIYDTPRLAQFISRVPKIKTCNEVRIQLSTFVAFANVLSPPRTTVTNPSLLLQQGLGLPVFHLSHLVRLFSSLPQALIATVEGLVIIGHFLHDLVHDDRDFDPNLWRELLQPFTAVKDLYLDQITAPLIAHALQELVGESELELFPILQNIFLADWHLRPSGLAPGLVPEDIDQFVAARQLASHPISTFRWWDISSKVAACCL